MFEEALTASPAFSSILPHRDEEIAGAVHGEGQQIEYDGQVGQRFRTVAEVMFEGVTAVLEDLKVSFSIFHRALPQAAISATLSRVTGRSVTKPDLKLTFPLGFAMTISSQLTVIASLLSRSGTPAMKR